MKWSIQQLRKLPNYPFSFQYQFDFKKDIESIEDIIDISDVLVNGTISLIDLDTFTFHYHVNGLLTLQCSLTLEPVDYPIDTEVKETYGLKETEEVILIDGNTVDLKSMVWTTIIVNKPIRVVRDDAYEILAERKIFLNNDIPEEE